MKIKSLLLTFIIGLFSLTAFAADNTDQFTPNQVQQIQSIVKDYLIKNPEILVAVSQALQQKQMVKAQQDSLSGITKYKNQIFNDANSPTAGNKDGDVILVEFFDYQCGHCKTMNPIIQALIKKNPNLKVIFKEFPIFGDNSQLAAKVALAANSQNKYFQIHDALLSADNPLTADKIWAIVKQAGLDVDKMKQAVNAQSISQQLRANFQLARDLKLMGTPAFIISNKGLTNFQFIPGETSQEDLQKQLDSVLNKQPKDDTNSAE